MTLTTGFVQQIAEHVRAGDLTVLEARAALQTGQLPDRLNEPIIPAAATTPPDDLELARALTLARIRAREQRPHEQDREQRNPRRS